MQNWIPYPRVPWLFYTECGCQKGGFFILDKRSGNQFHTPDFEGIHQYAADNSGSGLGNAVHAVTSAMGIPRCGGCAKRQAAMNGMFRFR